MVVDHHIDKAHRINILPYEIWAIMAVAHGRQESNYAGGYGDFGERGSAQPEGFEGGESGGVGPWMEDTTKQTAVMSETQMIYPLVN